MLSFGCRILTNGHARASAKATVESTGRIMWSRQQPRQPCPRMSQRPQMFSGLDVSTCGDGSTTSGREGTKQSINQVILVTHISYTTLRCCLRFPHWFQRTRWFQRVKLADSCTVASADSAENYDGRSGGGWSDRPRLEAKVLQLLELQLASEEVSCVQ